MCEEEMKIRGELESDIERDLEEEIKDGIYHLALRLHRLYQHKKERKAGEALDSGDNHRKNNRILSEVNISIRMEGGTRIEIKELRKEAPDHKGRPWSSKSENVPVSNSSNRKFDWAKSLRAGADPTTNVINRKNRRHNQGMSENHDIDKAGSASGSGLQRRGSVTGADNKNKVQELGWKW